MSEAGIVQEMKAKIDSQQVQDRFDMTSYETAYYYCRPTFFAFLAKYVLSFLVLVIHLLFWWVNRSDGLSDDANGLMQLMVSIVDFLGITGFVFLMLIVTWFNRFMNWSSSGSWYTTAMLVVTFTPGLFVADNMVAWVMELFGSEFGGIIPFDWKDAWYLILGVVYSAILFLLTTWYSRSFTYGISDRAVYLKKDFMLTHTMHKIDMVDIDNMKLSQPWYGRILGFGTVNMLTGSGFGVREHTSSVSAGGVSDVASAISDDVGFVRKLLRGVIFMVSLQRTREEMNTSEPEDCMYGIRQPSEVYKLINELKEGMRNQTTGQGTGQRAADPAQPIQEEVAAPEPSEPLDDLDADMDLN